MNTSRRLKAGEIWAFETQGHCTIGLQHGTAWLTISGDPRDHIIAGGDQLALPACSKVVISAECARPGTVGVWISGEPMAVNSSQPATALYAPESISSQPVRPAE